MAKVIDKRADGVVVIEVSAADARGLNIGTEVEVRATRKTGAAAWPEPFGALAGTIPELEIADIKVARQEALAAKTQ